MKIINQTSFAFGEVDPNFLFATDKPQYLQSAKFLKNIYVTSQQTLKKRNGLAFVSRFDNTASATRIGGVKRISFANGENEWITAIFYILTEGTGNFLTCLLINWKTGEHVVRSVKGPIPGVLIENISIDAADGFIVVSSVKFPPIEIIINYTTLSSTTISDIKFSVVPSIDTGEIDYTKWSLEISGAILGSEIEITGITGTDGLTQEYVGGLIISENGGSVEQPLATALIQTVGAINNGKQNITTLVMSPFDKDQAKQTTSGSTWSIRKPVWSATLGYPKLCSFYGGRLYLVGTRKYPSLICGSRLNTYNDFNVRDGNAVDAIAYLMQEPKGGAITHVFGGVNLNIWTNETQYMAWGGLEVGLTPTNFFPRAISDYTISKSDPLRYKDKVYFVSSSLKNIIQMTEGYQAAKLLDISELATHLINDPKLMEINVVSDQSEEQIYIVNKDDKLVCYSRSSMTDVNAFARIQFSLPSSYKILSLENIDNRMHVICESGTQTIVLTPKSDTFLDVSTNVTMTNNVSSSINMFTAGDVVTLMKDFEVLGDFTVTGTTGNYVINATAPDGSYVVGMKYSADAETMHNISSPNDLFLKKKKFRNVAAYKDSYNFTINGHRFGIPKASEITSGIKLQTGIAFLNDSSGYKQNETIKISQIEPYPLNILSIGYIIEGKTIL